jgi:flagellar biosynthesis protein FlhF
MQVKTFTGGSSQEVIGRIKAELGSEAVILDSGTFRENGRKLVRMTAALDRVEAFAPLSFSGAAEGRGETEPGRTSFSSPWQREWAGIRRQLLALMKPALRLDLLDERQRAAVEYLHGDGANDQALLELYRRLLERPGASVLEPLAAMLPLRPWGLENWPQRLHLVAGPFGAGKTTTAVRLALGLRKNRPGIRVCLINADVERGNGRLLLKHYAGLSDLSYREAGNAPEMAEALADTNSRDFERIIVDLPGLGRNACLRDLVARNLGLERLLSAGEEEPLRAALHLVCSPHYADEMQRSLLERYHLNLPASLVWSKLDECGNYASILNMAVASGLPVSCFSFGPGLLNTLIPADQPRLWKLLFRRELPERASGGDEPVNRA